MPRGVFSWTFHDVTTFLKDNGFSLSHVEGSHHYFFGTQSAAPRQVCVPFHGKQAFKPRTLKGMIAQSGIPKSKWFKQ